MIYLEYTIRENSADIGFGDDFLNQILGEKCMKTVHNLDFI